MRCGRRAFAGQAPAATRRSTTRSCTTTTSRVTPPAVAGSCRSTGSGAIFGAAGRRPPPPSAFISPDLCNDTHDCDVAAGDRFLAGLVPTLLRAVEPQGYVVLTWDE